MPIIYLSLNVWPQALMETLNWYFLVGSPNIIKFFEHGLYLFQVYGLVNHIFLLVLSISFDLTLEIIYKNSRIPRLLRKNALNSFQLSGIKVSLSSFHFCFCQQKPIQSWKKEVQKVCGQHCWLQPWQSGLYIADGNYWRVYNYHLNKYLGKIPQLVFFAGLLQLRIWFQLLLEYYFTLVYLNRPLQKLQGQEKLLSVYWQILGVGQKWQQPHLGL